MNKNLVNEVAHPPIVDFKKLARGIRPKNNVHFDMSQAVPWYPLFEPIRSKLIELVQLPEIEEYGPVPGISALRSHIAFHHPLSPTVTEDNIIITSGANHAIYTVFTTLFNPGEKIILLEPYYFNHEMALQMLNFECLRYRLNANRDFQFDPEDLINFAKINKAKGIVIVSPNNPTGVTFSADSILKLLQLTKAIEIQVIIDETYLAFDLTPQSNKKVWSEFLSTNLTIVGSFSKSLSLCGFRVGYLISKYETIKQIMKVQDTMIIAPCTLSMLAALHGLQTCQVHMKEKLTELHEFQKILMDCSARLKKFKFASVGVFFAYLRHPFDGLDASKAALIIYEETGILTLPGSAFGKDQEQYLRLAYCNLSTDSLKLACQSLINFDSQLNFGVNI